ncbi:LPXTG cell wall anchor domain-containing protein [Terrabacter sp. Ter38]|uniref:LPXTG cell wall anchor domain-containing protein n=1 Tax=Terrabacter sp. Ter38 TaxID=2926030 RepID=UPI0021191860|nr:LPXTG cell wall anchor domain-containing protein [Terrabacter sp. Ter38]
MRRIPALVGMLATLVVVAVLAACSGNGSVTLPTTLPSISRSAVPSASEPAASTPAASTPASSEPAVTLPELPTRTVPTETQTVTQTQTQTETRTQTQTQVQTETRTQTATVTQTETATVTETPSESESPTPTPAPTEAAPAAPTSEQGTTWWPWLLLLVLLGGLAWFLIRRRQAQAELQAWDDRLAAAEKEASWVEDSLTTQVLERPSAAEALPIWTAAQPRLLEIDEAFHTLATEAPDGPRAERATDIRGLLRGLVESVGADLATAPTADPDQFRARRANIDSARRELRATLGPVESPAAAADTGGPDTGV